MSSQTQQPLRKSLTMLHPKKPQSLQLCNILVVPYKHVQVDLGYTKQKQTYVIMSHTLVSNHAPKKQTFCDQKERKEKKNKKKHTHTHTYTQTYKRRDLRVGVIQTSTLSRPYMEVYSHS